MDSRIEGILSEFNFEGNIINCKQFGEGHINRTYLIETDTNKKYILQKINEKTFTNIDHLMSNMSAVCEFLEKKSNDPRTYMHIVKTKDGKTYIKNKEGAWRITDYIENTVCLQSVENTDEFLESAIGFGKFQNMLSDFPVEKLHETIVNFHNTPSRYTQLEESIKKDVVGRVKEVQKEIDYILSKKEEASILQRMRDSGELPSRVTHNDTKLNNVLLDEKTHKAICVIDLDTVMPGLAAYDFGDSIRFGAATAAEDEKDLNKVHFDIKLYEIFVKGFVGECKDLTEKEIETLPLGAKTITIEQAVRFLKDYIDGDTYYTTHYDGQNLDRTRTQIKLIQEMDENWDDMKKIIDKYNPHKIGK